MGARARAHQEAASTALKGQAPRCRQQPPRATHAAVTLSPKFWHSFPPPSRRRQCYRGMLHMVSADHFAQELRAQMSRAAKHGSIDIVINSGELYRSVGGYPGSMHGMPACCDAMRSEMKPGDILLVEQASGPGMTVRYRLPRAK
jgi:hypothetical protein